MSKYDPLWSYLAGRHDFPLRLSINECSSIAGVPVDHSFLACKKELENFGRKVVKISIKEQTILFDIIPEELP